MCGPRGLQSEPDHLFHNNGDGTFTEVSEKAGVADKPGYYGLSSLFIDINNDGKVDLLVADDSTPNYLYLNKGDGAFDDVSYASGYALNEAGRETASMGIAAGDFANNGMVDIFNTTFSDDYKPLYRNEGDANLTDISYQLGIAETTVPFLGWGDAFFDYDNDGWKDLIMADGHVYRKSTSIPGVPAGRSGRCSSTTSRARSSSRCPPSRERAWPTSSPAAASLLATCLTTANWMLSST